MESQDKLNCACSCDPNDWRFEENGGSGGRRRRRRGVDEQQRQFRRGSSEGQQAAVAAENPRQIARSKIVRGDSNWGESKEGWEASTEPLPVVSSKVVCPEPLIPEIIWPKILKSCDRALGNTYDLRVSGYFQPEEILPDCIFGLFEVRFEDKDKSWDSCFDSSAESAAWFRCAFRPAGARKWNLSRMGWVDIKNKPAAIPGPGNSKGRPLEHALVFGVKDKILWKDEFEELLPRRLSPTPDDLKTLLKRNKFESNQESANIRFPVRGLQDVLVLDNPIRFQDLTSSDSWTFSVFVKFPFYFDTTTPRHLISSESGSYCPFVLNHQGEIGCRSGHRWIKLDFKLSLQRPKQWEWIHLACNCERISGTAAVLHVYYANGAPLGVCQAEVEPIKFIGNGHPNDRIPGGTIWGLRAFSPALSERQIRALALSVV